MQGLYLFKVFIVNNMLILMSCFLFLKNGEIHENIKKSS